MKRYQDPFAITEIDFAPGPFRFQLQIEQQHLDFAVGVFLESKWRDDEGA